MELVEIAFEIYNGTIPNFYSLSENNCISFYCIQLLKLFRKSFPVYLCGLPLATMKYTVKLKGSNRKDTEVNSAATKHVIARPQPCPSEERQWWDKSFSGFSQKQNNQIFFPSQSHQLLQSFLTS